MMNEDPNPNVWLVLTPAMANDLRTGTLMLRMKEDGEIEHVRQEEYLADEDDYPADYVFTPEEIALRERFTKHAQAADVSRDNRAMSHVLDALHYAGKQWNMPPEPIKETMIISCSTGEQISFTISGDTGGSNIDIADLHKKITGHIGGKIIDAIEKLRDEDA